MRILNVFDEYLVNIITSKKQLICSLCVGET